MLRIPVAGPVAFSTWINPNATGSTHSHAGDAVVFGVNRATDRPGKSAAEDGRTESRARVACGRTGVPGSSP